MKSTEVAAILAILLVSAITAVNADYEALWRCSTWWAIPSRQTASAPTHTTAQWTSALKRATCGSSLSAFFPRVGPATSNGSTTHPASSAAGVMFTNKMWRYGRVCLAQGGNWCSTSLLAMTVFGRSRQMASTEPTSRTMCTPSFSPGTRNHCSTLRRLTCISERISHE